MADTSGLSDIQGYVAQLISLERTTGPEKYYTDRKSELTMKSSTLTDLDTNLSALNTQVQSLLQTGSLSPLSARNVTFSTSGYATATADNTAALGTHALQVSQLAKQSTIVSNSVTATGSTLVNSVGTGAKTFSITIAGVATNVTVNVGQNDTNQTVLTNMAAAINASGATVAASLVWDTSSTVRLSLVGKNSGSANVMTVQDVTGTLLSATGVSSSRQVNGAVGGYLYASSLLDARVVMDGLTYTRASNTISDLLSGVTFTLTGASADSSNPTSGSLSFTIAPDQTAIKAKVQTFLDAYNASLKFLKDRTSVSVTTDTSNSTTTTVTSVTRGTLADDFTYMSLPKYMRSDVGGQISSAAPGGPKSLYEIGITAAADGTLSISDTTKFNNAVSNNPDGVTTLFNSSDGIATRLSNRLTNFVKAGGILDNSQASVTSNITNMNNSINEQEKLLTIRQAQLTQQYEALAEVMAQLSMQQSVVTAYLSGLNLSSTGTSSTSSF